MLIFYLFRYHIPRSFLKPTGNQLVLFEEESGNPVHVSIDTVSRNKVCGLISDSDLPPVCSWKKHKLSSKNHGKHFGKPRVHLHCPPKRRISKILFASFGSPLGDCESYAMGSCHFSNSTAIVEEVGNSVPTVQQVSP